MSRLNAIVLVSALAMTTHARSQTPPATLDASAQNQNPAQSAMTAPAPATAGGIEEIIVTAQRRNESLQRAAIAVSALGGDAIVKAGITTTEGLTKQVPSLQVLPGGGPYTLFYLRGVGNLNVNAYADTAVAFNVDNVYYSRPVASGGVFYDLERVEVVKGPQGTLYGRNATGGAINVITRKPGHELEGRINAEFGNYDLVHVDAAANVPLGDKVAIRGAFQTARHDGYFKDGYDDQDDLAARLQVRLDPTETLSINLSGDTFSQKGKGPGAAIVPFGSADPRNGLHSPSANAAYAAVGGRALPDTGSQNNLYRGVSANIALETPIGTLTVIPAYRDTRQDFISDVPSFVINVKEHDRQSTVEGRLASDGSGPLNYVAGLFYFDEKINARQLYDNGNGTGNLQIVALSTKSYAAFGQLTYSLTDTLRATGGLRYTKERKVQVGTTTSLLGAGVTTPTPGNGRYSNVTYKAGVEFDLAPRSLLYASYATGFKAGGFYSAPEPNTYNPEHIQAFTIGSKNRFLDNRLQINVEAFYWKYKDQQISYLSGRLQGGAFAVVFPTANVGASRIKGVDVEGSFLLTPNTLLNGQFQYLDAKYTSFSYELLAFGPPRVGCPVRPGRTVGIFQTVIVTCDGFQMPQAPKISVSGELQQTIPLGNGSSIIADLRSKYDGPRWVAIEYLSYERVRGNHITDFVLTYVLPDGKLSVSGFVNNIENDNIISRIGLQPLLPIAVASLRPPRTYGVRFAGRF